MIMGCGIAVWLSGVAVHADPQLQMQTGITPTTLTAGSEAVCHLTLTNADIAGSTTASDLMVAVSWSALTHNGFWQYPPPGMITAPGGLVDYDYGAGGISGLRVSYPALLRGDSREVTIHFQLPESGLVNGTVFTVGALLTWTAPPGTLSSSAQATIQVAPELEAALAPVPQFTAPGGHLTHRVQYRNIGGGVAHQAWLVLPTSTNLNSAQLTIQTTNVAVWYSMSPQTIEQANSDTFIQAFFTPAALDASGRPIVPPGTMMLAVALDDLPLRQLSSGTPAQEFAWRLENLPVTEGTVIEQRGWIFAADWPATVIPARTTCLHALPTDFTLWKTADQVILTFAGEPETNYQLQRSTNLTIWSNLGLSEQTNPGRFQFNDPLPPPDRAFYRIATAPQ